MTETKTEETEAGGPTIPDQIWFIWSAKYQAWATMGGGLLAYFSEREALAHIEASGHSPPAGYSCYPVRVK